MSRVVREFYTEEDVLLTSSLLLGKRLCSLIGGQYTEGVIVETEAYRGIDDKACHAYPMKRTKRTRTMYLHGGHAYVYLCYGIHALFNIVTGSIDQPQVILIRGIEPTVGIDIMAKRRSLTKATELTNGPAKLAQALGINSQHNETDMAVKSSRIWLEDGLVVQDNDILKGPRVGLSTADECMNWPWRFRIKDNQFTSKPDKVWYS